MDVFKRFPYIKESIVIWVAKMLGGETPPSFFEVEEML